MKQDRSQRARELCFYGACLLPIKFAIPSYKPLHTRLQMNPLTTRSQWIPFDQLYRVKFAKTTARSPCWIATVAVRPTTEMCTRRTTQLIRRTTLQTMCESGRFCFASTYASFGMLERWHRKSSGSAAQRARAPYLSHVPTGSRRSHRHLLIDRPILRTKFDGCTPCEIYQIDVWKCAKVQKRRCSPCRIV